MQLSKKDIWKRAFKKESLLLYHLYFYKMMLCYRLNLSEVHKKSKLPPPWTAAAFKCCAQVNASVIKTPEQLYDKMKLSLFIVVLSVTIWCKYSTSELLLYFCKLTSPKLTWCFCSGWLKHTTPSQEKDKAHYIESPVDKKMLTLSDSWPRRGWMETQRVCPTCVGSVSDGEKPQQNHWEDTAPLSGAALSAFLPLPLSFFPSFSSLLSLIVMSPSSFFLLLPLAFSSPTTSSLPLPLLVWKGSYQPLSHSLSLNSAPSLLER